MQGRLTGTDLHSGDWCVLVGTESLQMLQMFRMHLAMAQQLNIVFDMVLGEMILKKIMVVIHHHSEGVEHTDIKREVQQHDVTIAKAVTCRGAVTFA